MNSDPQLRYLEVITIGALVNLLLIAANYGHPKNVPYLIIRCHVVNWAEKLQFNSFLF